MSKVYTSKPPKVAKMARAAWNYFTVKYPKNKIGELYYTPSYKHDFRGWVANWKFSDSQMDKIMQCWGVCYWDDWEHAAVPCSQLEGWEDCDCACPEPENGAAGVSENCPIHGGDFVAITSVM